MSRDNRVINIVLILFQTLKLSVFYLFDIFNAAFHTMHVFTGTLALLENTLQLRFLIIYENGSDLCIELVLK